MITNGKFLLKPHFIKKPYTNPMIRYASTMGHGLLNSLFECWSKKGNEYLTGIIDDYTNPAGRPCVDGDVTIWTTRPAKPPLCELQEMASAGKRLEIYILWTTNDIIGLESIPSCEKSFFFAHVRTI